MNSGMQIGHINDFYFLLLSLFKKVVVENNSVVLGNSLFFK